MKRFLFYVLIGMVSSGNHLVFGQEVAQRKIIVLDPGHGGVDSGAVGVNGIKEKDVVLKIAKEVIRLNRELYNDVLEIYLTRYSDTLISLGHRSKLARALSADIFLSIHCNKADSNLARGTEVYIQKNRSENAIRTLKKSMDLAEHVTDKLQNNLGFENRGVKEGNFQVLRETQFSCTSVLLELGFLSNSEEANHSTRQSSLTGHAMVILSTLFKQ